MKRMVEVEERVLYADTDRMGMAYYANYLRWFELGRAEYLRRMGMSYQKIEENGFYLPVYESYCRHLAPAHYDDLILIQAEVGELRRARIKFNYRILRKGDGQELARGFTEHVCLDREGKICRLPPFLLGLLK